MEKKEFYTPEDFETIEDFLKFSWEVIKPSVEEDNRKYEEEKKNRTDDRLTIEDFWRLSEKEKLEQYKNLSDHDRFLARISQKLF